MFQTFFYIPFFYQAVDLICCIGLRDVQKRNISALNRWIEKYNGDIIAIATHGTALSTMINYYYSEYNYESFMRILDYMPYVVKMEIDDNKCISFEEVLIVEKDYK